MSLLIAAPSSGAGKTTVTLGLLRALRRAGAPVRSAKHGPDYIDPRFHEAATGLPCPNLDCWAMTDTRLVALATGDGGLIVEGAMGLFDGAEGGMAGSGEDLALRLDLTVLLVLDCARTSRSIAAVAEGFVAFNPRLRIGGLILNRVGSDRHAAMLRAALDRPGLPPVLGAVPRDARLAHPARHLGLVQAQERPDLDAWLDGCGDIVAAAVDLDAVQALAAGEWSATAPLAGLPPLGQRIAVARDAAFAFAYPHVMDDWHRAGAEVVPFSPLADEAPDPQADAIFLPGGYPELHAARLAANNTFMQSLQSAPRDLVIYGECGGYMVLGDGLTDASGVRHAMSGRLRLETSLAERALHLGYRHIRTAEGPLAGTYTGHEFHYSTELSARGTPLFTVTDAGGRDLGPAGLRDGRTCGSYLHLIDRGTGPLDPAPERQ